MNPTEWYQRGIWPLAGSIIGNFITIAVAIGSIFYSACLNRKFIGKQQLIASQRHKLEEFYNPLIALLTINEALYENFGPRTFPDNNYEARVVAAEIWESLKAHTLLPNITKIRQLLEKHYHIYSQSPNQETYKSLLIHTISYDNYSQKPNEIHKRWKYSPNWKQLIIRDQENIAKELSKNEQ